MANRSNNFLLKRSNVLGKIPSLTGLTLGEVALNTADAKLYSIYTGGFSGGTEVRQIGWDRLSTLSGGTINGNVIINGSLSATTYLGLPIGSDTFITGFTYNNSNSLTISQNGGQSPLNVNIDIMSGLTINGGLTVTGTSSLNGTISSTNLADNLTSRVLEVSSGGTFSADKLVIEAYGLSTTIKNLLNDNSNWTIYGSYTGSTITGTYQGQNHYNDNYFYTAIDNDLFIRLIRG